MPILTTSPGSPSAQGLGYMLVQHKAELAGLRPVSVRIFLCNRGEREFDWQPCMVWTLKDAPPIPVPPAPSDGKKTPPLPPRSTLST